MCMPRLSQKIQKPSQAALNTARGGRGMLLFELAEPGLTAPCPIVVAEVQQPATAFFSGVWVRSIEGCGKLVKKNSRPDH